MTKTDPYFSSSEFDRWQHPTLPTLPETLLDRLAVITACSLGTDVAQINLVDEDHVITLASTGSACATTRRQDSPCGLAVEHEDVLCIEDLREDPRTAHLSAARTGTARFYAGTPIRTPDGQTLGTLAVLAPQPRVLSPDQRNVLVSMARLLERSLSHPNGRAARAPAPPTRTNEERLALALESADLGLWDWHIETGKVYLNDRWSTMIGYEPGEITPTFDAWTSLLHPDDAAPAMNTLQRHLDGTTATYEAEYRLRAKDGSWRWIQDRGQVTERAPDGAPIRAIGIHRDVTLRKQWETATREAEQEARRMNRLKTAFLANINHELRTPLTAILGFSEVLMTHDDPTTQEYAAMMHRSSQRLLRTFETIFDLTQIEDEDVRLHPQEVNATALARRVLSTFANEAEERGLKLSLEPSSTDATFTTDAYMVRRALTHLISNAIKFTDAGSVTLRVHGDDATVTYEVQDTGRGISPDYLSRLFDAFTQESEGHARNYEGCGLGLHITSRLVDLLGGSLSVDSTPDAGTTVRIRLPRQPEPISDAPA